ncbi:MAG: hypothetical protein D8M58_17045 [Calditrichaeota bacterium]|nr:MAG: hypothetical protein DWQ03_12175 [Calditrichota bacterium]MBL1207115.1 hypothetical protein [Calditrichota bacterium]NOG46945.1 hypothetical protein [Calditrichota bacterium]
MRKYSFILILVFLPLGLFAQINDYLEDDPQPTIKNHRGLAYSLLETGSGLGFFYELPVQSFFHLGLGFDAFMLRDRNEINYSDIFGNPRTYGKENNVFLFDLMFTVKKRLFVEQVDDSFRPFITAAVGPVFGMNFPEIDRTVEGVKREDEFRWTGAAIIGAGLDADVDGKYFFGFRTQYRFMPFAKQLGERKDHSMIDIRLEIGQRF